MRVLVLLSFLIFIGLSAQPVRGEDSAPSAFGVPGFLVISGAADTTGIFTESSDPGTGRFSLVWDQGALTLPDSLPLDDWGPFDKGVAFTAALTGAGESGTLVLRDGIFPVTEPVVLSDGLLSLSIAEGELEIRGARITYRRFQAKPSDYRSGLLMLAGMTLLVIVLLRRARLKAAERTGS